MDYKLKLKVLKRGTHMVRFEDINNDVPSPVECVAEYLAAFEYHLGELVRLGGNDESTFEKSEAARYVNSDLELLNNALRDATRQGWVLTLEGHPTPAHAEIVS